MWLSLVVSILTNPTLVSGLGKAGQAVVDWWHSLSEEDRAKIEANAWAIHAATASQIEAADADLKSTRDYLDAHVTVAKQHPGIPAPVADALDSIFSQVADRMSAPLPAPQIVNTSQGE